MADFVYKPSIDIQGLINGLKNLKKEAASADQIIGMIGNRGNLNKLLTTFLKMDDMLDELVASSDRLKANFGNNMKAGYIANLNEEFGKLASLLDKTATLSNDVLDINLNKKDAKKQISSVAHEIDSMLKQFDRNAKIDFELFDTLSIKEQRDELIRHINDLGSSLTVAIKGIDTSQLANIGKDISDGFEAATGNVKNSGDKLNKELQNQNDVLEAKLKARQKIIDKVKEYQKLIQTRDSYDSKTHSKEYKMYADQAEELLESFGEFKKLGKGKNVLDDVVGALYDFEENADVKQLENTFSKIFDQDFSNAFSLDYIVNEMEYIQGIASNLQKIFNTTHNATLEYNVLMNGQKVDIRSGGHKEVDAKTQVEAWLANLEYGNVVDAHSHMGASSQFNSPDLANAIRRQYNGLAQVSTIIGKDDITTLDLSVVKLEDAYQVLKKLEGMGVNSISSKNLNKLFQEVNPEYGDVAKTWKPEQFLDLAQFITDVGKKANTALTPLDRFKNILKSLTDGKIDFKNYAQLLDTFTQENAGEIFNKIARQYGIEDADGNLIQVGDISKSSYDQILSNIEQEKQKFRDLREEANVTYQDIVNEAKKYYDQMQRGVKTSELDDSFFKKYFHSEDMQSIRNLFMDIEDGTRTVQGVANALAFDFNIDPEDMTRPFDEMGAAVDKASGKVVNAKAKIEEFAQLVRSLNNTNFMDNKEIGATTQKLESMKQELEELATHGAITEDILKQVRDAYDSSKDKLRELGYDNWEYGEPRVSAWETDSAYETAREAREEADTLRRENEELRKGVIDNVTKTVGDGTFDGTTLEAQQLTELLELVKKVTTAVNNKTQAFEKEANTVNQIVPKEIKKLKQLEQVLEGLKTTLNGLFDNLQTNVFSALEGDIKRIEVSAKNIGDTWKNIEEQSKKITSDPDAGEGAIKIPQYALDGTLQKTNSILGNILSAIKADDGKKFDKLITPLKDAASELNKVASGIIERQKIEKTDKSDAIARIKNKDSHKLMSDIVRNDMLSGTWSDVEIGSMTALANGLVKVEGAVKDADGAWQGFTTTLDASDKVIDMQMDKSSKLAKTLNRQEEVAKKAAEQIAEEANIKKLSAEELQKQVNDIVQTYTDQGKEVTVQQSDSGGRYTVSTKETIGGLTRDTFQTFDQDMKNIERATVTVSNKIRTELDDTNRFIQDNLSLTDNLTRMTEYNKERAKLLQMEEEFKKKDNLSDNEINAWNDQINLVRTLGNEITGVIKTQQKLDSQKGIVTSKERLSEYKKSAKDALKGLDFSLTDNDSVNNVAQREIVNLYDQIIQKTNDYQKANTVLTDAQSRELDELNEKLKARTNAYKEDMRIQEEARVKAEANAKLPQTIDDQIKSMDEYKKGLKNVGLLTDDLGNKFDDLKQRMKNATDIDDFNTMQKEWAELQKHIDAQQNSDATKNRKAQIERSLKEAMDSVKKEAKKLDFDVADKDLTGDQLAIANRYKNTLNKLYNAKTNAGKQSQDYIAQLEAEANSLISELKDEVKNQQARKKAEENRQQARKDSDAQKQQQNQFDADRKALYKELDDYKWAVRGSLDVTGDLAGRLRELGPMLAMAKTTDDLKVFQKVFKDVRKDVDKSIKQDRLAEGKKLTENAYKEFNSLKIDETDENLTRQQKDLIELRDKLNQQLKNYNDKVSRGVDAETHEIEATTKALREQIQAYKDRNKAANPANAKFGKTAEINASIKYDSLTSQIESDSSYNNSKVMQVALESYNNAYDALIKKRKELMASPDPISEGDEKAYKKLAQECNSAAKAVENIIKATNKLHSQKVGDVRLLGEDIDVDNIEQLRGEFETFVGSFDNVVKGSVQFDEAMKQMNFAVKNTDGTITNLTAQLDAAGTSIVATAGKVEKSTSTIGRFVDDLKTKFKSVSTYVLSMIGIEEVWQQLRNGVQYVRDIDTALTELKKVTSETDKTYDKFLQTASKTAGIIGSTVQELTSMTAEWARLGYSIEDSAKLAESTAILLNVSEFTDVNEASEALISTMQGFGYVAKDSQHVVDILNEVGNNYAVSSDGLASALQHSASALAEGGNNLEQSVALIAAANKVVQDPDSVGNALKTISLRIRGTSLEVLEEMGEETDGMIEGVSKMQEKIKAASGVDILTETGAYKDTYTILKEIGEVWEDMSDINQAALLELLAGKHRANTLAAILDNMEDLKGAYESAMDAEGSALRENEAYLDSIQGRVDLFTNALQTFWMNLISSDMAKAFVDIGTGLIKFIDTAIGKITAIVGALAIYKKFADKISFAQLFKDVGKDVGNAYNAIMQMVTATKTLNGATLESSLASKLNSAALSQELLAKAGLTGVTGALTAEQTKSMVATLNEARANGTLTTSQYLAAMSTMGLKTALQGLWTVLKANPIYLVAAAVTAFALAFDHFTITSQEAADSAHEAFDSIQKVVENTKSTIQSLESELSTLDEQISALDGKQLSFAEEQELNRLKQQREELEHSLKVQEQLLALQQKSSNEKAVAAMKAYTKAASEGADETQKTATTWGTIGGIAAGVAGVLLAPVTGGTSLVAIGAGAAAGGIAGNKIGEWAGSKISENEGTYDSWYETYTKALETAREEEQKALKAYQKDSSNIDKLDKWQEAQQKTSDIETEMYEHLTQMQQYFSGIEYGVSEEMDKELDTWNNFLDKFSIDQGASGAEVTALDRIFGENASEDIQSIKSQILEAVGAGEDFNFESAINGSEELKNILDYVGLSAEDVKNYFTQIGEAAVVAGASGPEINPVETYSATKASIESYNDILSQTSEILGDNTQVTREYKDSIIDLVGSEEAVNKCFDSNNDLIVTNAKGLKDLIAQNVRLEKAQSQLDYYELVKQLNDTLDGTKQLDAATRDSIHTLLEQIDTVELAIAQYQLLENSLLGISNAFDKFAQAQEIDAANTYGDSYVEMAQTIYDAYYKTGEVGTHAVHAAVEALIDPSVYAGLEKGSSAYNQAVYKAFNETVIPTLKLDEDALSIDFNSIEKFVSDGLGKIFEGTNVKDFKLMEGMDFETAVEKMQMTETQLFAFFGELQKYTGVDYFSELDQSLEGRITNITKNVEELNRQKLSLLEDGGYEKHKTEIDAINKELATQSTNMKAIGEEAYQAWQQYAKNDTAINALNTIEDKQQKITEQAAKELGLEWNEVKGQTVQQVYDELLAKQLELGEPTELSVQFAKDNIDVALEDLEAKLKEKDIDVEANIVWNEEEEKWETSKGSKYAGDADVQEYVELKNDQYALEQYLDSGLTSTETYLSNIENILQSIYDYQTGKKDSDAIAEDTSDNKIETIESDGSKKDKSSGDFWESINNFGAGAIEDVNQFLTEDLPQFFTDIGEYGHGLVEGINTFFSETIPQAFDDFWTFVGEKVSSVKEFADGLSDKIDEFFSVTLPKAWNDFWTSIGDFTVETLAPALGMLWTKITHIPEILNNWGADVVDGVKSFFTDTLPQFFANVNNWGASIATKVKEFFSVTIPQKAGELVDSAKQVFEGINNWGAEVSRKIQNFFGVTIPQKAHELLEGAGRVFEGVNNWGAGVASKIQDFFTVTIPAKFDEFVDGIESGIEGINNWGADLASKVKSLFTEIIPDWWERFKAGFKKGQNEEETRYQSEKANDVLKEVGKTDYTFNLNSDDINNIKEQIEEAQRVLDKFVGTDGTLNVDTEGCEEAQIMLATLITKKQQLETPAILKVDTSTSEADVQEVMNLINEFKTNYNTLELQAAVGADTTEAQEQLNTTISTLQATSPEIVAKLGIDPFATAAEINTAINGITPTMMIDAGVDKTKVDAFKAEKHTADGECIWENNSDLVDEWMAKTLEKTGTVKWKNNTRAVKTSFTATGTVNWKNSDGPGDVNGTAHSRGTAYKGGSWGAPRTETALVGELGPEMVVRNGRWFTVGENGAEFTDIKRGDIIFNHKQTEQLLSKGYVIGRGKAYASGTAYNSPGSMWNPTDSNSNPGSSSNSNKSSNSKSNSSKTSDAVEDAAEQIVDFIEFKLEEIEEIISKSTAKIENIIDDTSKTSEKSGLYDTLVQAEKDKAETYLLATTEYNKKANELLSEIPEEYKKMAQNGAIAIEDFIGDDQAAIADAINNYREWVNKADDAEVGYLEAIAQATAYRIEQLNDIADDYDNLIDKIDSKMSLIEAHVDLVEESGERVGASFYEALIAESNATLKKQQEKLEALKKQLKEDVESGEIVKGDDAWYEALELIDETRESIVQCQIDAEAFQNAINDITWDNLDKLIDRFDALDSELSHIYDRLTDDNIDVSDKDGNWTDEGIAAIGIAAQQMETAQYKAQEYGEAIKELERTKSNYSEDEYNEKLAELTENQWEAIEAYEDAKDKIIDLNEARVDMIKEGIDEEIEANEELIDSYKELIDQKLKLLDAEKDAHDFEKSVNEKQKSIADLERKIAALSLDNSISATAQRKQLEAELAEAKMELEETYYDRSIENQKNALNEEAENYEKAINDKNEMLEKEKEALDETLKEEEKLISDSLQVVKNNTNIVLGEINAIANKYGIDITDAIVNPWKQGSNAISGYKDSFSQLSSAFSKELAKIEAEQDRLQQLAEQKAQQVLGSITQEDNEIENYQPKEPTKTEPENKVETPTVKENEIKVGGKINAAGAKIYDYAGDTTGETQYFKNDPIYIVVKEQNGYLLARWHKASASQGNSGWFKKSDVKAYAKGTTSVPDDQWAWIDEIGEELVLHAGASGKLAYMTKGSGVVPADLTSRLMDLAIDPTQTLENSRPVIGAPHIANNEINISMEFGSVVNIEHVDQGTIPNLTKAIEKQMDKYMKNLNGQIRKYTR